MGRIKKLGFLFGVIWVFGEWSGGSGVAKKKNVRRHQNKNARRNQKNVSDKEARDGERAHVGAAANQTLQTFTHERDFADCVGSHGGGEVGALVPGEQVAGEGHGEDESEENATGEPKQFAAAFVGAVDVGLRKVEQQDDNHRAGAVKVETAKERTGGDAFCDVSDGGVRVVGGGNVIERQENSGDDLRNENEQQAGAEYVGESSAAGNGFVKRGGEQSVEAGAAIQPSEKTRFNILWRSISLVSGGHDVRSL